MFKESQAIDKHAGADVSGRGIQTVNAECKPSCFKEPPLEKGGHTG
jgi:hypothetical protein